MRRPGPWSALLLPWLALTAGCASYSQATEQARSAYYAGEFEDSAELWTELLTSGKRGKDGPLMLLERGMALFAMGRYLEAANDFQAADQQLEVMDFTSDPAQVGKYLFSEDSGLYRGPPHEKILAPTLTSLAFSALGDHENARTAANSAYSQIVRFEELGPETKFPSPLALILLGLAAEANKDPQRAHTALAAAYQIHPLRTLEPVLLRLLAENARRFGGHWTRRYQERRREWGEPRPRGPDDGELVVVVLHGKVPIRTGSRLALDQQQQAYLVQTSMSELQQTHPHADMAQAQTLFYRQNSLPMAVLAPRPSRYAGGAVHLPDGTSLPLETVLPVERQCVAWFEANRSALTTAALTRLAFRMAVRVGSYLAIKKKTDDSFLAILASATAGAILEAVDTPDTRSWTLLPKNILLQRQVLPAGSHGIELAMAGASDGAATTWTRTVDIAAGETTFAVFVVPE